MSAFVCIFERSGAEVDPRQLERLAAPLAAYGPELATTCRGPLGIAVRHRGAGEARHRHGPLVDPATGVVVAVAGHFRELGDGAPEASSAAAGSGERALAACRTTGGERAILDEAWLAGLSGAFVLVAADPASGWLEIVRDHLGSRKVYYTLDRQRMIAASEPGAILRHGAVSDDLDEVSAARFLGFRFGHTGRSFFRQIRELAPAHRLRVSADAARVERFWRFAWRGTDQTSDPAEIERGFRRRLSGAVAGETAGLAPPQVALSLSGGLDSPAIAALAPPGVRIFSWTFDDSPEADERGRVAGLARHLGLDVEWVRGDGHHPLSGDFVELFVHPGSPYVNPFSALKRSLYTAARAAGCERVLVGDGGDAVYSLRDLWLRDLLASAGPRALPSLAATAWRAVRGDRPARRALRRLPPPLAGLARRGRRPPRVPWLTAAAQALLPEEAPSPIVPASRAGAARLEPVAGVKHGELESEERRLFAACGVERGNPFWSWPLLEMTSSLPATWHRRDRRTKVLTREAMRGLLPREILEGKRQGFLGGFFLRGIAERRDELRRCVFRRPRSDWQHFVRREWLEPYLEATGALAFGHTILWRVISYELWQRRLERGADG